MLYRARQSERRLAHYADNGMSDYIAMAKYARYRPELGRREIFAEGVERVRDMHLQFFAAKLVGELTPERSYERVVRVAKAVRLTRSAYSRRVAGRRATSA